MQFFAACCMPCVLMINDTAGMKNCQIVEFDCRFSILRV